jgi:hypothetical protein
MNRALTIAGYLVLAVSIVAYELRSRRRGTATFGDALRLLVRARAGRMLVLVAWLWLGWHLFARVER